MKTKAAILHESNTPLVIDEVEIPALKKGQVLVKILCSGVCRAQLNEIMALKGPDRFLPHLLGHEASAIVEKIGRGVTRVKKGDYVVLSWIKGAGEETGGSCYRQGDKIINAGAVTTFSEHAVVSENRVTKISKKVPPDVAAIIGCAVATGAGIVNNTLEAKRKSSIVVFGVGGVGLSAILAAKLKGCGKIIAVDIFEEKLSFAKKLGATHGINIHYGSPVRQIKDIVPDGVDHAIDASGNRVAMEAAFEALNQTGMLVIAGNLAHNEKISIHPFELIKGKRIVGTWGGETVPQRDFPKYANDYCRGQFPIDRLITHRFRLEQVNEALRVLRSGAVGRIVLEISCR